MDTRHKFDGHGIQHLIAHHHAQHLLGQGTHPLDTLQVGVQGGSLALFQCVGQIDDGVAPHGHAHRIKGIQNL